MEKNILGSWAFLVGVIIAIVVGALGKLDPTISAILVVLGLVVGLLNVTGKEVDKFLMAGTVLVIVSSMGGDALSIIPKVGSVLNAILTMFVPATIIVALKHVFSFARD